MGKGNVEKLNERLSERKRLEALKYLGKRGEREAEFIRNKAEGKKLGRPGGSRKKNPILLSHSEFIRTKVSEGAKQTEIARELKVHRHTVKKWITEYC